MQPLFLSDCLFEIGSEGHGTGKKGAFGWTLPFKPETPHYGSSFLSEDVAVLMTAFSFAEIMSAFSPWKWKQSGFL